MGSSITLGDGCIDCREDRLLAATLHEWVKKAEVDSGKRAGVPTEVADKMKALESEVRELRQANEILHKASAYFAHRPGLRDERPRRKARRGTQAAPLQRHLVDRKTYKERRSAALGEWQSLAS